MSEEQPGIILRRNFSILGLRTTRHKAGKSSGEIQKIFGNRLVTH